MHRSSTLMVAAVVIVGIAIATDPSFAQGRRGRRAQQQPAQVRPAERPLAVAEFVFAPHPKHNHSSCIVQAPNGDLLVCWYRGSGERLANDVAIMGSRKRAGSDRWEEPFIMADTPNFPDCNPAMIIDPRGTLHLFWEAILDGQWSGGLPRTRRSTDYLGDGPPKWAWQDEMLFPTPPGFVDTLQADIDRMIASLPNDTARARRVAMIERRRERLTEDPIRLRLGWQARVHPIMYTPTKMLVPLSGSIGSGICGITEDGGQTWRMSFPMRGAGGSQPALVRKADGGLVAYLRHGDRVHMSTSADGGETWSPSVPTDLPMPGSSVEAITLRNGHWVMIHNDVAEYKGRFRLAVRVSTDEGATWSLSRYLENDPKPAEGTDPIEFSYPSAIEATDGLIHVTYTHRRAGQGECIKHIAFDEAWITEGVASTRRETGGIPESWDGR